jgi:hypothetical protein
VEELLKSFVTAALGLMLASRISDVEPIAGIPPPEES